MSFGFEKEKFLHTPTPLEFLSNISHDLGLKVYIKRDDLTGIGVGGNKLRKLEYLVHDAKTQGATMLLTVGGAQTNHGRLTAAVAAKYNMKCCIVSSDEYPGEVSANILLDVIMGSDVTLAKQSGHSLKDMVAQKIHYYEKLGEKVYYIPLGGSNELGALGYYDCSLELINQVKNIDNPHVISTIGSMGTYMGLFLGLNGKLPLTGVLILPYDTSPQEYALDYYNRCCNFYGIQPCASINDFDIQTDYVGEGYNIPSKKVREAIYHMARREAIILDPCYTGKAFAGIESMISKGKIKKDESVVFLHTGGQPGINTPVHRKAMEEELSHHIDII